MKELSPEAQQAKVHIVQQLTDNILDSNPQYYATIAGNVFVRWDGTILNNSKAKLTIEIKDVLEGILWSEPIYSSFTKEYISVTDEDDRYELADKLFKSLVKDQIIQYHMVSFGQSIKAVLTIKG